MDIFKMNSNGQVPVFKNLLTRHYLEDKVSFGAG